MYIVNKYATQFLAYTCVDLYFVIAGMMGQWTADLNVYSIQDTTKNNTYLKKAQTFIFKVYKLIVMLLIL